MHLDQYLDRIGYQGDVRHDLATLNALHEAHLRAIPYECLDVQLGRPVTTDPAAAYAKIVERGRGGWCYEMNGLFGWALGEAGFKVTRMAGAVMRVAMGDASLANHLVLKIDMDDGPPVIADVGFGDGPLRCYRLIDGPFSIAGFDYRLQLLDDGWWRLHHHPNGSAPCFDFRAEAAAEAQLAATCVTLQTSPASPFVQNLVCGRHHDGGTTILRGKMLRLVTPAGVETREIGSPDELLETLNGTFGLDVPEVAGLWGKIVERHATLFPAGAGT